MNLMLGANGLLVSMTASASLVLTAFVAYAILRLRAQERALPRRVPVRQVRVRRD